MPIIDHCQDMATSAGGVIRSGKIAEIMGVPGMPGEAESNMVGRNVDLCRKVKARIHGEEQEWCDNPRGSKVGTWT